MSGLRWYYRDDSGGVSEMVNRVRTGTMELITNAEEGSTGTSSIVVDDTSADFVISGHRKIYAVHDDIDAATDGAAGVVWVGYSAERDYERGVETTGAARQTTISVVDLNTVLEDRLLLGTDCNRPAETDLVRLAWLLGTTEAALFADDTYVSTTGAVAMDACDYRKQKVRDVLDDCAQESGKNWFVVNLKQTPDAEGDPTLFGLFYDFDSAEVYSSDIQITNDPVLLLADGDISAGGVYAPSRDTKLTRSPSRVYSGVVVDYDGGYVYAQRADTATAFRKRDTTMSAPNVKTKARATARGRRYLRDLATEEDVITTAIHVKGPDLNCLMAGQRVECKFTHLPGYESFKWLRVINRTVREIGPDDDYEIAVELATDTPATTLPLYGVLRQSKGPFDDRVYWGMVGDTPAPGYLTQPTTGLIEAQTDGTPPNVSWPFTGWKVTGTGTIDVLFYATTVGVLIDNISFTITWSITLNGVVVASESQVVSGFLVATMPEQTVTVTGLSVVPDDIIEAHLTCVPPTLPFFMTPAGTGQVGERLEITGGSLV